MSTEIDFPCTLWLPKATVSGPCAYDGIVTIFASGTPGTCSVELEFSNGFKYATTIEYTQEGASGPCPYVVPSVDHIKVGFPLCGEDGGNACVMSCGCVDSYDAAGTIFVDAGKERIWCEAGPDDDAGTRADAVADVVPDAPGG